MKKMMEGAMKAPPPTRPREINRAGDPARANAVPVSSKAAIRGMAMRNPPKAGYDAVCTEVECVYMSRGGNSAWRRRVESPASAIVTSLYVVTFLNGPNPEMQPCVLAQFAAWTQ